MVIKFKKILAIWIIAMFTLTSNQFVFARSANLNSVQSVNCNTCANQCQTVVEHIKNHKGSPVNMVEISPCGVKIIANNVLEVTFTGDFNSKNANCKQRVSFVFCNGLVTEEGRGILPCGTQVLGTIQQIQDPKWMNRNAKVFIIFDELVFPCGKRVQMCAKPFSKDCSLKNSSWKAVGKAAGYTVGMFGIGAGLGAAIGTAGKASVGCMTYGMPIGAGVGLLAGTITPGLNYKAKEGQKVYIQLVQDLCIPCACYQ